MTSTSNRRLGAFFSLALVLWAPRSAQAEAAPSVPEPPSLAGEPHVPQYRGSLSQTPGWTELQLGVAHLVPREREPFWVADWVSRVTVPLFSSPGAEPDAWLLNGWLVRDGEKLAFDTSAMIEIGYESLSFVVLELRADGWFRFDLGPAAFWTHTSLLALGELALVAEPWEELFQSEWTPPLHFRDRTTRHALRGSAAADGDLVSWIGRDHSMEILEVAGEWMRVRVSQPAAVCGREDPNRKVQEGWIRWRSPEKGPWIWYPARGC